MSKTGLKLFYEVHEIFLRFHEVPCGCHEVVWGCYEVSMRFHEVFLVLFSSALILLPVRVSQWVSQWVSDEPRYRAAIAAKNLKEICFTFKFTNYYYFNIILFAEVWRSSFAVPCSSWKRICWAYPKSSTRYGIQQQKSQSYSSIWRTDTTGQYGPNNSCIYSFLP